MRPVRDDGVRNFRNTLLFGPQPTIITFDAPGAVQVRARAQSRSPSTRQGQSRDATPTQAVRFTLFCASERRNHRVRRSGRGDRPPAGHSSLQHQPSGCYRWLLQRRERCVSRFPAYSHGVITTFNVPGAGTAPGRGTFAGNINPLGAIAGRYVDASDVAHGFLRTPDGTFTTFDAPNAGTGPGQGTFVFTGSCLNPAGAIAAASLDASDVYHGILRAPDGTMTTFDAPGAGTGPFQGTLPLGINQAGTIEGNYVDASDVNHGFCAPRRHHHHVRCSGRGHRPVQGTSGQGINAPGDDHGRVCMDATTSITALCAVKMARLPHLMFRAQAQGLAKAQSLFPTIPPMRSRDTILTRAM